MPKDDRWSSVSRSTKSFQENVESSASAAGASYTMIGAIVLLGGVGYAVDRWRDTSPWFLVGGLFVGVAVGLYELAKTVWHR
jgi:F0F1-type ATP synthase assembly protein I